MYNELKGFHNRGASNMDQIWHLPYMYSFFNHE